MQIQNNYTRPAIRNTQNQNKTNFKGLAEIQQVISRVSKEVTVAPNKSGIERAGFDIKIEDIVKSVYQTLTLHTEDGVKSLQNSIATFFPRDPDKNSMLPASLVDKETNRMISFIYNTPEMFIQACDNSIPAESIPLRVEGIVDHDIVKIPGLREIFIKKR